MAGGLRAAVFGVACAAAFAVAAADEPVPPAPPPAVPAAPSPAPAGVDLAVARGAKWLLGEQDGDGGFGSSAGETALALWALRASGTPADAPAAVRAAARLEKDLPDGTTYGTSLGVCALLAHDPVRHRERAQRAVDALVEGRCENGQWSYLVRGRRRNVGDNSNTQCAALALGAARARGLKIPREAWQELLAFAERTRNEDGGWGYSAAQQRASYGSMTAGMAMAWTLARAALDGRSPAAAAAAPGSPAAAARDWLGRRFDAKDPPGLAEWRVYWLWSVERAASAAGWDRVGDRDWYAEGARRLVESQNARGSWIDSRPVADTAWALLFLRRATAAAVTPDDPPAAPTTPSAGDGR